MNKEAGDNKMALVSQSNSASNRGAKWKNW